MHLMTLVHFDEAMIHMTQFSLVISHCNITFSVFRLSQGSVAALIRSHVPFIFKSVKTTLKLVSF